MPPAFVRTAPAAASVVRPQPVARAAPPGPSSAPIAVPAAASRAAGVGGQGSGIGPQKPPLTLDYVVQEWQSSECKATNRLLRLGQLADHWVRGQASRPTALRELKSALIAAGVVGESARVGRFIACYWAARLYGISGLDVAKLPSISAVRVLAATIQRNKTTQVWAIRPHRVKLDKSIREKIANGVPLTAAAVEEMLGDERPSRQQSEAAESKAFLRLMKQIPRLRQDELQRVADLSRQLLAEQQQSQQSQLPAAA